MLACAHVCWRVRTRVSVCVWVSVCVRLYVFVRQHVFAPVFLFVFAPVCVHLYVIRGRSTLPATVFIPLDVSRFVSSAALWKEPRSFLLVPPPPPRRRCHNPPAKQKGTQTIHRNFLKALANLPRSAHNGV